MAHLEPHPPTQPHRTSVPDRLSPTSPASPEQPSRERRAREERRRLRPAAREPARDRSGTMRRAISMGAGMASMASREPTLADFEVHSVVGEGEFGRVVLVSNR